MNTVDLSRKSLVSYGVVELSKKEKNKIGGGFWFAALQAVAVTGVVGVIILAGVAAGYGIFRLVKALEH